MYKVELRKTAINDHKISSNPKCILTISLEANAYESGKMAGILKVINKTFTECTIIVGSLLERHNYVFSPEYSSDQYIDLCEKKATLWLKNNLYPCMHELKIPSRIILWDYFLQHPKFDQYLSKVEEMYSTNAECRQAFDASVAEFMERRKKHMTEDFKNINEENMIKSCISYLKEEAAAFCIFPEFNSEYEIYYNKRTPVMQWAYDSLTKPYFPNLLQLITLRFLKYKNTIDEYATPETSTLKSMLEILPGHIYWKNREGRYLGCNAEQAKYYGLNSSEDIVNKTDFDVLPFKAAEKIRLNDLKIMEDSSAETVTEKNKNDYFLSIKSTIKDDMGKSLGIVGCSINITKQKNLEKSLKVQIGALSEVVSAKEYFLNNLSHEIRTPMHVIGSIVTELSDQYFQLSDDERLEFIKLLQTASEEASKLIKNILTLAKGKKGTLSLKSEKIDIVNLTKNISRELSVISIAPITVNNDKNIYVKCTKYQIEQVVRNLVENAIKYGNGKPININILENKKEIYVEVIDQGIGVPKSEILEIFEAFKQGSRTRSMSGGTGLGLAICRDIINIHNGKIWVEPLGDIGSKFVFSLPF